MLRCLILFRSTAMSSSRLIVLRSMTLATICAYGRTGEFTRVGSSRRTPSNDNAALADDAARFKMPRGTKTLGASAQKQELAWDAPEGAFRVSCPVDDGDASTSSGEVLLTSLTDLLRLPLRSFLFHLPSGV